MSNTDSTNVPKAPNGEGSVWLRKDGRWCASWREFDREGNKRRRHAYAKSEEEARALLEVGTKIRDAEYRHGHLEHLDNRSTGYKVYFAQCVHGGPIKIGVAKKLRTRMLALQTGCPYPLRVLSIIDPGGPKLELELHRRFARHRLHGEWFRPAEDLKGFIDALSAGFQTT